MTKFVSVFLIIYLHEISFEPCFNFFAIFLYTDLKFGAEVSFENVKAGTPAKGIPFGRISKLALSETVSVLKK